MPDETIAVLLTILGAIAAAVTYGVWGWWIDHTEGKRINPTPIRPAHRAPAPDFNYDMEIR